MDYRRKRGLVEEINRVVLDIEADTVERASLRKPVHVEAGLVEVGRGQIAPAIPRAPWHAATTLLR
jgi:hypothetical protein